MMRDDLIKRSDAIKSIEELPNAYNGWSDAYDKACLIGTLEEVPSADRPQGEWKEVYAETDYRNGWIEFSCECCEHQHGLESGEYGWSYGEPIPWKFCPLCGARMVSNNE